MHEVKVFDSSGNLRKIITVESLNERSEMQMSFPAIFKKNKKGGKNSVETPKIPSTSK